MSDNPISLTCDAASKSFSFQPNSPRRILVVDDDSDVRRLNTEVLIHFGYHVDAAEDGAAAWETLQLKNYDLIISRWPETPVF